MLPARVKHFHIMLQTTAHVHKGNDSMGPLPFVPIDINEPHKSLMRADTVVDHLKAYEPKVSDSLDCIVEKSVIEVARKNGWTRWANPVGSWNGR